MLRPSAWLRSATAFRHQYINGAWVASTNTKTTIDVVDPSNGCVVATVPSGSATDSDKAVLAARAAFDSWARTPLSRRKELLAGIEQPFERRKSQLVEWLSKELGCPKSAAASGHFPRFLNHLKTTLTEVDRIRWCEEAGSTTCFVREPIGVVSCITPWNYPLNQIALKIIPAMLAGCTVVLKPSEVTPVTAYLVAESVHEAGLPPGVFNMVVGDGPTCGEALVEHPQVDMVTFTGSTRAGKRITEVGSRTLKHVKTELGGKSAVLLLDDADLPSAIPTFMQQLMNNTGQSCNALSRMLVPKEKYDEAVQLAKDFAESIVVGHPSDPDTQIGPIVSDIQWQRVQQYLKQGLDEGARLVTGGLGKPPGLENGFFVKPTVFADVHNGMTIAQDEIFGPVLSMIPYDTEDEAINIVNDTIYGLNNAVGSSDFQRALRIAGRLRSGMVMVNRCGRDTEAPFGGYKQSGNAREGGLLGLHEYLVTKTINVSLGEYQVTMHNSIP